MIYKEEQHMGRTQGATALRITLGLKETCVFVTKAHIGKVTSVVLFGALSLVTQPMHPYSDSSIMYWAVGDSYQ